MKTLFGAVAGALALGAVLVAYHLGEQRTFSQGLAPVPLQAGQAYVVPAGQDGYAPLYAPYGTQYVAQPGGVVTPAGVYAVPAAQRVVTEQYTPRPAVRRVSSPAYSTERATNGRSWQKSAMIIGGSAASGAGVGAVIGGKKGAGIGALIGGGIATLYDQAKRH